MLKKVLSRKSPILTKRKLVPKSSIRRRINSDMSDMTLSESKTVSKSTTPVTSTMTQTKFVIKIFYKAALIFLGYIISYLQGSFLLLLVLSGTLIYLEHRDRKNLSKIKLKAEVSSFTKHDLIKRIDEIPSWVKFPDRERAEWLNQIIVQLWPTLCNYIVKHLRTSIQTKIRKKYDSFQFENIDFGERPPKIDGIKVYNGPLTKDSIIVDFDVFYDGDCDINVSISGAEIGGIRDFQLSVEVRVVLKPLLQKLPLIGGIQIYFLNTPEINFTLDGYSSIPGLSSFIRSKIEEKIARKIVFPNKITKRFSKSVAPSELKALEPAGVLRVHVFEAKDLMGKDFTGKSDPYVVLYVGAQEFKTSVVNQNLNPKWDNWCEFVVIDPISQHLGFKIFDKDNVNEDDFLGSGELDISTVLKGQRDQWIKLDNAKHGSVHLRFTWLALSQNIEDLEAIQEETRLLKVSTISTAVLVVYVDMALNLPESKHLTKPHPYFYLSLGEQKHKSRVKKHTNDPAWEQGFVLLVPNVRQDSFSLTICDKSTGSILSQLSYNISNLLREESLEISKSEFMMNDDKSTVIMSLQLRILTNSLYEMEDDESDFDSDEILSQVSSIDDEVEEVIASTQNTSTVQRSPSIRSSSGEHRLGRLELTISYSEPRQKLLLTVHQIHNLPLKDPNDIPDPYVRIRMFSGGRTAGPTYRTKVIMDNCNPIYEETFEYSFSKLDANELSMLATVKTKKFLHNNTMGQVEIDMKYINLDEVHRQWCDICPKPN